MNLIIFFLKGETMIFRFNKAQLSKVQRESLEKVLAVMQVENEIEIEVIAVEFPEKFKVKLDNDVEMLVVWDGEKKLYSGLTEPQPEPESTPESQKDTVDIPAPELDLSPVLERAGALATALVNLVKPLNTDQRCDVWIKFCTVSMKGFLE